MSILKIGEFVKSIQKEVILNELEHIVGIQSIIDNRKKIDYGL